MGFLDFLRNKTSANSKMASVESPPGVPVIKVENDTDRTVTIETQVTDTSMRKCNLQPQSRLFQLPGELRNAIFEFATRPYDDPKNEISKMDFCYRPGHEAKHKTSTGVLLTCRRAWLEANTLPMLQAEHCFWFRDSERKPAWLRADNTSEEDRLKAFLARLTPRGRKNIEHVHFFAQMFWLEDRVSGLRKAVHTLSGPAPWKTGPLFPPKILTITIRHFDWWGWENHQTLSMIVDWVIHLLNALSTLGVETFRLELETLENKFSQLLPIIERIKGHEARSPIRILSLFDDVSDSGSSILLQGEEQETTWSGPADGPWPNSRQYRGIETLNYRVVTLVWKSVPGAAPSNPFTPMQEEAGNRNMSSGDHRGSSTAGSHMDTDMRARYEQKWEQQDSLLKFAE